MASEIKTKTQSKKILNVPFVSQHSATDSFWKNRSCAIACLKMVLDFIKTENYSLDELIKEGEKIGGYTDFGWLHDALVKISRNHGVPAYAQEFRSVPDDTEESKKLLNFGLEKIVKSIENDLPVIITVREGFGSNTHTHIILVTGYQFSDTGILQGFYINDPDDRTGDKKEAFLVDIADFLKYWRKYTIFWDKFD